MGPKSSHEDWVKARPREMKAMARWLGQGSGHLSKGGVRPPSTAVVYAHRCLLQFGGEGPQAHWRRMDGGSPERYTPEQVASGFQRVLSYTEATALLAVVDHNADAEGSEPQPSWDASAPELLAIAEELLELATEEGDPLSHRATRLHVLRDQLLRRGR